MSNYTLYHGDCLEILPTLEEGIADAVITDPPYSSGGTFRGDRMASTVSKYVHKATIDTWRHPFSGDNRDQRSFIVWCSMWFGQARRVTKQGGMIACFTDWRQLPAITDAMQCGGWVWRGIGTWWKPGIRMHHGHFSSSAEYIVFGSNGEWNRGELSQQNVFKCVPIAGNNKNHIAEKPISVLKWLIGATPSGSVILDPFMGSGTTGLACIETGRDFIGIDIDKCSVDTATPRIANAPPPLYTPAAEAAGQQEAAA